MPAFSVVIPCYNAAATLAETLSSVLDQTFWDFEVILVDDGSTDATVEIAEGFAARSSRIKLVKQANAGPSVARNRAVFEFARGDYIAFLDADDLWPADKLNRAATRFAQNDAPEALYGRVSFFKDSPTSIETTSTVLTDAVRVVDLIAENVTCTMSNVVITRDAFIKSGGFNTDIVYGEDVEWLVRVVAGGARVEAINAVMVYYRTSENGLSANLSAMRSGWDVAVNTAKRLKTEMSSAELKAAEATHLRYLARRALRLKSERGAALSLAVEAIGISPRGFFKQPQRGVLTLGAAIVEALSPAVFKRLSANR